jgi:hypothetical protein
MASAPQANRLPVLFNDLVPLNSQDHAKFRTRTMEGAQFLKNQHAVPLTAEEFTQAQRNYPIIFSAGADPVPLALMGMNEGVNVFLDDDAKYRKPAYVPAYVRRYPFMLARLRPDAQDLSLCFDPTCDALGEFEEGDALFDGDQPSETTKNILSFCEDFERAVQNTSFFMEELKKHELLMDGELKIEHETLTQPYVYQGFQMVNEQKLRDLRGDELRKLNQNGALPLIHAHLFSLQNMRDLFAQQAADGLVPNLPVAAAVN